ncbi:MAG: MaoC/PaaZ C-terminal domain-containing protein [bacterium]
MIDIENIKEGDPTMEQKNPVGKYQPIFYGGASGDFNPIHIDPEFGKMAGLGGNILQGLCTMAFVARMHTDWAGDPGALKRLKVRFSKPVMPLDKVTVKGKVVAKEGKTVKCEVWAENQNGDQVIKNGESTITLE